MLKRKEDNFENYKDLKKKSSKEKKHFMLNIINPDIIHAISLLGYVGFLLIGSILINIGIYKLIERYFFKSQILFFFFVILGVVTGFYNVYKVIMKK